MMVNQELQSYIEQHILPRYEQHDAAHRMDHVQMVIAQSLTLAERISASPDYRDEDGNSLLINMDMAYAIAAYHDTGLCEGRETHHVASARIIREDKQLRRWFTEQQIELMADAAEDHRASAKSAPRTIYGRIVAEADRAIDPITIIRRTIQYGLSHYPQLDKNQHYTRMMEHMSEKYDVGGYLRLWIAESPNAERLEALRAIIHDEGRIRAIFEQIWSELIDTESK